MSTLLVVEDGTGLASANTFVSPNEAAQVLAERGFLRAEAKVAVASCTFAAAAGTLTRAAGDWADFVSQYDIVRFEGGGAANSGWDYVDSATATALTLGGWLALADEGPITVTVTAYAQSGWWRSPREVLEATLTAAADWLGSKYGWLGEPIKDTQGLPWPRKGVYVGPGSRYYAPGTLLASDEVPLAVRRSNALVAAEEVVKTLLETTDVGGLLKSKTVGPLRKEWFAPGGSRALGHVNRELWGLYRPTSTSRRIQGV